MLFISMLASGVMWPILGLNVTNSFDLDASKYFPGSAIGRAVRMLVGGAVPTLAGLVWTLPSRKEA
jgi:hypothetical protein